MNKKYYLPLGIVGILAISAILSIVNFTKEVSGVEVYWDADGNKHIQYDYVLPQSVKDRLLTFDIVMEIEDNYWGSKVKLNCHDYPTGCSIGEDTLIRLDDSLKNECKWDYTLNKFIRVYFNNGQVVIDTTAPMCNELS